MSELCTSTQRAAMHEVDGATIFAERGPPGNETVSPGPDTLRHVDDDRWYDGSGSFAPSAPMPLGEAQLALLDELPASVAVIDVAGVIRSVNSTWRQYATENGGCGDQIGRSYVSWTTSEDRDARRASNGVLSVVDGTSDEFAFVYPCHSPDHERWFEFLVVPLATSSPRAVLALHVEVDRQAADMDRVRRSHDLEDLADTTIRRFEDVATDRVAAGSRLETICAWCRVRRRDAAGAWVARGEVVPVETGRMSHGICDSCLAMLDVVGDG